MLGIHYVHRIANKTDKACPYGTYLLLRKEYYLKNKSSDGKISRKKIKQVARRFRETKAAILDEVVKVFLRRRHMSWT